jgi:hypothetical protein
MLVSAKFYIYVLIIVILLTRKSATYNSWLLGGLKYLRLYNIIANDRVYKS